MRLSPREPGLRYGVEHHPTLNGVDSLLIETNADGAEDFKIVTAPLANPGKAQWRDLVPHKPGRLILSQSAFRDFLLRLEREDGLPRIIVRGAGFGHGVGLSQYGAYGFAKRGADEEESAAGAVATEETGA